MDETPSRQSPLTRRQEAVLRYIRSYSQRVGYPPTLREIGRHFGIRSTNGVSDHLRALERKGHLRRGGMKSRALRPVGGGEGDAAVLEAPLLGRVAAGAPVLAAENVEATIRVDPSQLGRRGAGDVFALRVRGDSMIDDGILDGDTLFVRRQDTASRGDVVVALIGEEATVKRFEREGDAVRLVPANRAMEPIVVRGPDLEAVRILGVAVGLHRKL
jgi:repressor LexA